MCAFEKMANCFESIAYSTKELADSTSSIADSTLEVASAIEGSYSGQTKSAFFGMMQALFMMVDADNKGQGLHVIKQD